MPHLPSNSFNVTSHITTATIGTASISTIRDSNGKTGTTGQRLGISPTGGLVWTETDTAEPDSVAYQTADITTATIGTASISTLRDSNGNTGTTGQYLVSNSGGQIIWTQPPQPLVCIAYLTADESLFPSVERDLNNLTIEIDNTGGLDPGTGIYTAPSYGIYRVNSLLHISKSGDDIEFVSISIRIDKGDGIYVKHTDMHGDGNLRPAHNVHTYSIQNVLLLNPNDKIKISLKMFSGSGSAILGGFSNGSRRSTVAVEKL